MSQDIIQLPHQHLAHLEDEDLKHAIERNFREIAHMLYNLQLYEKKTGKPINSKVDGVIDENGKLITGMLSEKMVGLQNELQLAEEAVTEAKLAVAAVVAEKIKDGEIVTDKIAANAVTGVKILAGEIATEHLAAKAVTAEKMNVSELSAISSNIGTILAGSIAAGVVQIGPDTTFAEGYDPTDNHLYFQYSADGETSWHDTFNPATDKYMRQKVGDDGTWSDPMRVVGEDGRTPVKGADYFDGVDGTSAYLWVRYSQNSDGDPMTTDPTGAVYIGVATTTTPTAPTSHTAYQWSLIKGQDGVPGEAGADGQTSYLHIKYSDDGETFTSRILTETESGEDFTTGELDSVVAGGDGLELELSMGKALSFDGVDNKVSMGGVITGYSTAVTLEAWIKSTEVPATNGAIAGQGYLDGGAKGFGLYVSASGNIGFQTRYMDTTANAYYAFPFDDKWHHVAGVRNQGNNTTYLYLDGELVDAGVGALTSIQSDGMSYFGLGQRVNYAGGWGFPFEGLIDDVRLWNVARTQQQIQGNMDKELTGDETGLIGYWKLDEGTGTAAYDSASTNHGTIDGATWVDTPYKEQGSRISPPLDLSSIGTAKTSEISWNAAAPTGTSIKIETSLSTDGGTTYGAWQQTTNGGSIPGIVADMDLSNAKLKTRATLETEDTSVTPVLESLTVRMASEADGETVGAWIGTYVDFVQEDSTDFEDYTWNKVRGEDVRKFTSQPVPPYDIGDLWIGGSDGKNTLVCVNARESGDFVASDWKPMTAPDVLKVDNRCKALFHFDGSINDHRGIMPTFTRASKAYLSDGTEVDAGVPRFEDGKFDKAVLVEEGTTNLVDSTAYRLISNSISFYPIQDEVYGEHRRVRRNPDFTTYPRTEFSTYTPEFYTAEEAGIFTYSLKVKPTEDVYLRLSTSAVFKLCPAGVWTTLTYQDERLEPGDFRCTGLHGQSVWGPSFNPWIEYKEMQVEFKPYPTSFTPSTRSPETLTIPTAGVLNPQEGAVVCRVYVNDASKYQNRYPTIFTADAGGGAGKGIWLCHSNDSAYWRYQIKDENNNSKVITVADSEIPNGWHFFAIKWKSTEAKLFVDGVLKGTMENPYLPSAIQEIGIGCRGAGNQLNSLIDDLAIFDYAPTDEEIQAWYEADAPFYALDLPKPELPGYVKIESDGLRVYDIIGQLRGVFGSWLKDSERKYGIKIIAQDGRTIIIDEMGIMAPIWSNAESVMLGNQMQYQSHPVKFYIPAPKANIAKLRLSLDIKPTWIDNVFMYHYDKSNVYLQEFLGSYILVDPGHGHDIYHNFEYYYPVLALNVNIFIDGVNRTGELGGPWQLYDTPADLDILPYIDDREGWHTLQFKAQDGATVDSFVTGLVFMGVIEDEGALMLSEGEDLLSSNWEDEFNEFI